MSRLFRWLIEAFANKCRICGKHVRNGVFSGKGIAHWECAFEPTAMLGPGATEEDGSK